MLANIARGPSTRYVAAAMPELPEVETICQGLAAHLLGHILTRLVQRRPDLRRPLLKHFADRLTGRRFLHIDRRAKYILMHFDDRQVLLCHLGMKGRMLLGRGEPALDIHDHVIFYTDDGTTLRFNDVRRFGLMDLTTEDELNQHKLLAGLGPEPLSPDFNGKSLAA